MQYTVTFLPVGTTTFVAYLLDGYGGARLAQENCLNSQRQFGTDVIFRLQHAIKKEDGARNIEQNGVRILPNIAGFVGGDMVVCMVATRFDQQEELTLLIDSGTNGEMVLGVRVEDIRRVYLAGAFGNDMDPASACRIGMIHPVLRERIVPIGNGAGSGARLCALSREMFAYSQELADKTECLELASLPQFQDRYIAALEL